MENVEVSVGGSATPLQHVAAPATPEQVCSLYRVKEPVPVIKFLRRHGFLVPLLLDAHVAIETVFGPGLQADLALRYDPRTSAPTMLYVRIPTQLSRQEAHQLLATLDEQWWNTALERADDKLMIDIMYV